MEKVYTFEEWANVWLEDYKRGTVKANTFRQTYQDTFRLYLNPTFGGLMLHELTKKDLRKYLTSLSNKYSYSTLNHIRLCVKGMYDAAIEEGLCLFNPAVDIRVKSFVPKQKKSTYSAENVDALFLYASNHKYGLGVCLLLDLGLRCSEMLGLQWRDVDFVNHCIDVSRASVSVDGKAYVSIPKNETSVRTLPLSSRLERLLYCAWLQANRPTDDSYIVPAPSGAPYTPANFTKNRYNVFFKDANTDLGLQRLSPHELRHTCGTNLYARSGDISAVSAFLGHSSVVVTTKFYVHISTDMMRKRLQI